MDPDPSCFLLLINFGNAQLISLLLIIALLICSGLISACGEALFSLKVSDFPTDKDSYTPNQHIIVRLLDKPQRLLAMILVANTFFNIAIVFLFETLSDEFFKHNPITLWGVDMQFAVTVVVATFFILLFGEILPKVYGIRKNVALANLMAIPLNILDKMLSIFSVPMERVALSIQYHSGDDNTGLSVDQLSRAIDLADEEDTTEEEQEILQSIVDFGNKDTKQVMQPRTDIFALNTGQSYQEIIPPIIEKGYSRIPVFKESLDNVEGILYIKDLLPYLDEETFNWQSLLREPYFVPENKKLDDLLNEFKDKRNHLAIVVDEYGGTSGLISMEDIMEEILGEISDEFDDVDLVFSKLDEDTFVFEGKTPLIDFYRIAKIEDATLFETSKGDAETIAGFLLEISGDFPKRNEKIEFEDYVFAIEAVDEKRIKQVKFSK